MRGDRDYYKRASAGVRFLALLRKWAFSRHRSSNSNSLLFNGKLCVFVCVGRMNCVNNVWATFRGFEHSIAIIVHFPHRTHTEAASHSQLNSLIIQESAAVASCRTARHKHIFRIDVIIFREGRYMRLGMLAITKPSIGGSPQSCIRFKRCDSALYRII